MKAIIIAFVFAATLLADGVGIILQRDVSPWRITIFSSSVPLRSGPVDIAVLVETEGTREPVTDANVRITFRSAHAREVTVAAVHSRIARSGIYLARWNAQTAGQWQIAAGIERGELRAEVPVRVTIVNAGSAAGFIPLIAPVPVGIALFALNRLLSSRTRKSAARKSISVAR